MLSCIISSVYSHSISYKIILETIFIRKQIVNICIWRGGCYSVMEIKDWQWGLAGWLFCDVVLAPYDFLSYFTVLVTECCDVNLQLGAAQPVQNQVKAGQLESSIASKLISAQMVVEERLSRTRSSIYLFPRTHTDGVLSLLPCCHPNGWNFK